MLLAGRVARKVFTPLDTRRITAGSQHHATLGVGKHLPFRRAQIGTAYFAVFILYQAVDGGIYPNIHPFFIRRLQQSGHQRQAVDHLHIAAVNGFVPQVDGKAFGGIGQAGRPFHRVEKMA